MNELIAQGTFAVVAGSVGLLLVISFCGGVAALLQAIVQVQEASITHLARLLAFGAAMLLSADVVSEGMRQIFMRAVHTAVTLGGR